MKINFFKNGYDITLFENYIIEAYNYAIEYLRLPCKDLEVNISMVSRNKIKELNNLHRGKDTITDVLSFPTVLEPDKTDMNLVGDKLTKENFIYDINPSTDCIVIGDICICLYKAKKQAVEYNNSIAREVTYLAIHGLLHLLGYDHMKEDDKSIMRKVEEDIMTKVKLERD